MSYLVSVIVPVYNIEKYLRKCVDSIINQTLKEIEIILVDDGSTDNSGQICDAYAAQDARISVIHKANGGLSSARNDGIKKATAPFIMFVDGDDWVAPDYCESPYRMACENHADLVLFSYQRVYHDGRIVNVETNRKSGILTQAEAMHYNIFVVWAVWIGLYKREIFDRERFPDGKLHEDTATTHRFIHEAKKICLLDKKLYHYRVDRFGSIMNNPTTRVHPDLREMLTRKAFDLSDWGYREYAQLFAMRVLIPYGEKKKDAARFRTLIKAGKVPKFFNWKYKAMFCLYRFSPSIFNTVCNLTGKRNKI